MQQNTTTKTLFYISAELKNICMYMSKAQSRLAKAKAKTTTRNKFLKIEKKNVENKNGKTNKHFTICYKCICNM